MTRPIKFRAWDGRQKKMLSWDDFKNLRMKWLEGELKSDVYMQFTGLLDKNGKEIYEGDVVRNKNGEIFIVNFGKYYDSDSNVTHYGFFSDPAEGWGYGEPYEVIGNIYENPELIK